MAHTGRGPLASEADQRTPGHRQTQTLVQSCCHRPEAYFTCPSFTGGSCFFWFGSLPASIRWMMDLFFQPHPTSPACSHFPPTHTHTHTQLAARLCVALLFAFTASRSNFPSCCECTRGGFSFTLSLAISANLGGWLFIGIST